METGAEGQTADYSVAAGQGAARISRCPRPVMSLIVAGLFLALSFQPVWAQPRDGTPRRIRPTRARVNPPLRDEIPIISMDISDPALMRVTRRAKTTVVRSPSGSASDDFAYPQSVKGRFTEVANEVSVEYVDGVLPKPRVLREIEAATQLDEATPIFGKRHRLRVRIRAKDAIVALNQRPDVRYAYPVLYDLAGLNRMTLTDRIVVCLVSPDVSIESINTRHRTETVAPLEFTEGQWVVRLTDPKNDFPLDVSEAIAGDPNVAWAEPDFIREWRKHAAPNDTFFGNQWHLHSTGQTIGSKVPAVDNDVDAPEAWDITTGSSEIVVAIVDDGLETDHPDIAANVHPSGYDYYDNDDDPNPAHIDDNHGTACAGVATAVGNNSLGVAGAAYNCRILPVKIIKGPNFASDSVIANAIRYAARYADVISCSWGGTYPSTTIQTAIRDARQDGVGGSGSLVFAASGNGANGFVQCTLSGFPGDATFTFRWKYVKDSILSAGEDTCWLDSVTFPDGATEDFDTVGTPGLPIGWTSGGDASWITVEEPSAYPEPSGTQCARAGSISDSQETYLETTRYMSTAGDLVYYMRTHCEATYDYGAVEIVGYGTYLQLSGGGGVDYPGGQNSSVAVGASNSAGIKSLYSQYGPELDLVAPSNNETDNTVLLGIETIDRTGTQGYNTNPGTAGDYCKAADSTGFGGTSSATPLSSGIAALVRSVNADLSPAQIRNIMRETADKIDSGNVSYSGRQTGRNDYYGWGRVNAYAAVTEAVTRPDLLDLGADLTITELADDPAALEFIEIYNSSATTTYALDNLALTDNEAGSDTSEGSCRFPEGYTIPAQGAVVVVVGSLGTQAFVDEVTANAGGPNVPAGGVQMFELIDSGLSFDGSPIPDMELLGGPSLPILDSSDNVMLVVTDGYAITFLSEVVDGVVFGTPALTSGCDFGVDPRLAETGTYADNTGLDAGYSLQRLFPFDDTDDSFTDFHVMARNPGLLPPPTTVDAHSSPQADTDLPAWNDTEPERMSVLKFRITDHGEDGLDTLIDELVVSVGGTAGEAANDIAWAELSRDGVGQVATASSITNSEIVFGTAPNSDSTAQLNTVAENTYVEYTVNIYFNSSLLGGHGETYVFDTDETNVGVDLSGNSSLMAGDTEAVTPVVGTIFISEIGVTVTPDVWNIGQQLLGYVGESGPYTVENTGSVAEDITIIGSHGSNGWVLADTVNLNAFKVEVDKDDDGSYETVLSATEEKSFADNVPVADTETLGLKYSAPSGDTYGTGLPQDSTVTVRASPHVP